MKPLRIAVVGTGIAGNTVAHRLHAAGHDISVFEAGSHVGGHTHTHAIVHEGEEHAIDTGFIVFNDRTYPNFMALLDELDVLSKPSTMSFSVRNDARALEYNGSTLGGLFVQRRNLLRPGFHWMLREILRFHREAPRLLERDSAETPWASSSPPTALAGASSTTTWSRWAHRSGPPTRPGCSDSRRASSCASCSTTACSPSTTGHNGG